MMDENLIAFTSLCAVLCAGAGFMYWVSQRSVSYELAQVETQQEDPYST
jgi:hypothetical protein